MELTNPGWLRLAEMKPFEMKTSDLTSEMKVALKDTVTYSMRMSPDQLYEECVEKCLIAIMSEYAVADWLEGYVNKGIEDLKDPYTYAFDVVAHPKYNALRIEVKTHQSGSKWIGVTTGYKGEYPNGTGINLGPFINFPVADLIIVFKTAKKSPGCYTFIPWLLADKYSFHKNSGVVAKSNFDGWYLTGRKNHDHESSFHIFH